MKRPLINNVMSDEPLIHLLLRTHRRLVELTVARLRQRGHTKLRIAFVSVLPHIAAGETRATAIAARAGVSKQAIGRIIDDLERAGYVFREIDPGDSRAQCVALTKEGAKLVSDAKAVKEELEKELAVRIGTDHLSRIRQGLANLLEKD